MLNPCMSIKKRGDGLFGGHFSAIFSVNLAPLFGESCMKSGGGLYVEGGQPFQLLNERLI